MNTTSGKAKNSHMLVDSVRVGKASFHRQNDLFDRHQQCLDFRTLVALVLALGAEGVLAQELEFSILAERGSPAPGTMVNFKSFYSAPIINEQGAVAFTAEVDGNLEGIWTGLPGALQKAALEGEEVTGLAGVYYDSFDTPPHVILAADGTLGFISRLKGAGITPNNDLQIEVGSPGAFQRIYREGDPAPGTIGETFSDPSTLFSSHQWLRLRPGSRHAFRARLNGAGTAVDNRYGIWGGLGGTVDLLARATDSTSHGNLHTVSWTDTFGLSLMGEVYFTGLLAPQFYGIFQASPGGGIQRLFATGDDLPGGGHQYLGFYDPTFIEGPGVAFRGWVPSSEGNRAFLWAPRGNAFVSSTSQPGANVPFRLNTHQNVNGQGRVLTRAKRFEKNSLELGLPWGGGIAFITLLEQDRPAPLLSSNVRIQAIQSWCMNDNGLIVAAVTLSGPSVTLDNQNALYLYDSSLAKFFLLARFGSLLETSGGSFTPRNSLRIADTEGNAAGQSCSINNRNEIVFRSGATDNLDRIVLARYLGEMATPLRSAGRVNEPVRGFPGVFLSKPGPTVVNALGRSQSERGLVGPQTRSGKSLGILALSKESPELVLQSGTDLSLAGSAYDGLKATRFSNSIFNQEVRRVFQASLSGPGSQRAVFAADESVVWPVIRTGIPMTGLGGAMLSRLGEMAQHHTDDSLAVCYSLRRSRSTEVNAKNDTGILLLKHDGTVLHSAVREGQPTFDDNGIFGQFPGRVAMGDGEYAFFIAPFVPTGERKARQGMFQIRKDGTLAFDYFPPTGTIAAGVDQDETFSKFLAVNERDFLAVLRATLKGGPKNQREGIWNCGSVLWLRKGVVFDPVNLPGVFVRRILKFWPVGADQLVVQVVLGGQRGSGMTGRNNQALLLRQGDESWRVLLRSGVAAPGAATATVSKISAVDVDRVNGHYSVLGSLRGAPASANQALWTGQTSVGTDALSETDRLPVLRLRKGGLYSSEVTASGVMRSLALRPVVHPGGAGARGQGQVIGAGGHVVLTITTDKSITELVVLEPQ